MTDRSLWIVWLPTLRCNLNCTFCNARSLRIVEQEAELPPAFWRELFASVPHKVNPVTISGGEPSLYAGLREVLETVPHECYVSSNLTTHPQTWLTEQAARAVRVIGATLQFDPTAPQAQRFFEHLDWLRHERPQVRCQLKFAHHQHTPPRSLEVVRDHARRRGIECLIRPVDHHWAWRHKLPLRPMTAMCSGGHDEIVILPDGGAYRCTGHAWGDIAPIGSVVERGWDILLDEPALCEQCLCSRGLCDHSRIEKLSGSWDIGW